MEPPVVTDVSDGGVGVDHGIEEDAKFLEEGDETPIIEKAEEGKEEGKEKVEEEPPEGEKPPEGADLITRASYQQIIAKYPTIFKEFPDLREVYFREQAYNELFPSVEDAREALENVEAFTTIREGVLEGRLDNFFQAVKEADSLERIADRILPDLNKVSPDLHLKAVTPLIEGIIQAAYKFGDANQNEDLKNSALQIALYLFGDAGIAQRAPVKSPALTGPTIAEEKLQRLENERFGNFQNSTDDEAGNELIKAITLDDKGKDVIDPEGTMTKFARGVLVDKIVEEVGRQLKADRDHMIRMTGLWKRANQNGYTREWKSRIVSAYLARAKALIPAVRSKLRADMLGNNPQDAERKLKQTRENSSRREPSGGRPATSKAGPIDARKVDWGKTSDLDFLEDRVTLRK